ncbi:hypothetical protein Glove_139g264 [Diversispora epigaea]|uniref:Uncharacterized protein n=1 Tax=Diversispora epigaea TaxID=1348612 RepID=A0A397IVZ5_9GLOM|nr:hypothetical protein Glove_139g264 [Diversispora epigaea]
MRHRHCPFCVDTMGCGCSIESLHKLEIGENWIQEPIYGSPLRESSEECAIQLHHYTPQDETDKGMFSLQEIIKNRENFNNKNNSNEKSFENDYQVRKGKLEIRRLREIMRVIIQRAIEVYLSLFIIFLIVQLVDLWDKCLIHQCERDEFFESLQKIIIFL